MTPLRLPLRIVFVAPFGLRQKSTVWARTLPLARELNRLGHNASILVPPWDSVQDAGTLMLRDGVRIENVALAGGIAGTTAELLRRLYGADPDIVHIVKPRAYAGIVQWLLWRLRRLSAPGLRIVLDIDDWEKPWADINGYPWYQTHFLAWQETWGIRHADAITAASRWLYDRAARMAPSTPRLYLPNGVEEPAAVGEPQVLFERESVHAEPSEVARAAGAQTLRYGHDDGGRDPKDDLAATSVQTVRPPLAGSQHDVAYRQPPRVLMLSRFVEIDPTWLGQMWRQVREHVPDAVLLVAGRALHARGELPYFRALQDACAGQHAGSVAWLGYVNPGALADLYANVDCAIFPSADTALLRAKCSVRMAGALSFGVPVVASAVGEQAAYGADGAAYLVPSDASPAAFADEVAALLADAGERATLSRAALARMAASYRWPTLAQSLVDFYVNSGKGR